MARKNLPQKTKYSNILEVINADGKKEFLATWVQANRQYYQKNLTRLFGSKTAAKASTKLDELRVLISRGEDPFKKDNQSEKKTLSQLVIEEINNRDVSESYKYVQLKVYEKYLGLTIGHLKLEQLSNEKLQNVFQKLLKTVSYDTVGSLKKAIRPTFSYAVDEQIISSSPLNTLKFKTLTKRKKKGGKVPLKHRLLGQDNSRYLNFAKAFFNSALNFSTERGSYDKNREYQIAFLLDITTARRRGELLSIKYEDITDYGTVKTEVDTTKTDVYEEYPLPKEVLDRLEPNKSGLITPNITPNMYSHQIRRFIDNLGISIHANMKLDGHDARNLFLTIMSKETKNPFLCDSAISHEKSKYAMLLKYYDPDISDYIELFDHYWSLLRGERELIN